MKQMSKELKELMESIDKWSKKHKLNVCFVGGFLAFKGKDFKVSDDRMFAYGDKETLLIELKELTKQIKKEKKILLTCNIYYDEQNKPRQNKSDSK